MWSTSPRSTYHSATQHSDTWYPRQYSNLPADSHWMVMHYFPSQLVFSTRQNQPKRVQNFTISSASNYALALIFGVFMCSPKGHRNKWSNWGRMLPDSTTCTWWHMYQENPNTLKSSYPTWHCLDFLLSTFSSSGFPWVIYCLLGSPLTLDVIINSNILTFQQKNPKNYQQ